MGNVICSPYALLAAYFWPQYFGIPNICVSNSWKCPNSSSITHIEIIMGELHLKKHMKESLDESNAH